MRKKEHLKVFVAYGWQKFSPKEDPRVGNDSKDVFWKSIYGYLQTTAQSVADASGVPIEISRLSAGAEGNILDSIISRIKKCDVVVLDLAAPTKIIGNKARPVDSSKILTAINQNVLFELGMAYGMGKKILVFCPCHLVDSLPSDVRGRFMFLYHGKLNRDRFDRVFVEGNKLRSTFREMLVKTLPYSARRRMKQKSEVAG